MKKQQVSSKRDQYTAVLENIHSQNKIFGEALTSVYDELKEVHEEVTNNTQKLGRVDGRLSVVETDLELIKNELAIIRHNQVTRDEFKLLETRVSRLEKVGRG